MYHTIQYLALSAFAISNSAASPLQSRTVSVNCNDVATTLDPSCWIKLNMTGWLEEWALRTPGANTSTPTSIESSASSDVASSPGTFGSGGDTGFRRRNAGCEANELWSNCFLRLGLGKTGRDCSTIDIGQVNCMSPRIVPVVHTPQIFQGLWNIYAINQYISSIYLALRTVYDEKDEAIRTAASIGPGNVPLKFPGSYPVDSAVARLLLKLTDNQLLPNRTNTPLVELLNASRSSQTYDEKTSAEALFLDMQDSLVSTLTLIMSDLPTFVKFAENGTFSTESYTPVESLVQAFAA